MICGIGTDIVRIERVADDIDRFGERFAARILARVELEEYRRTRFPARFLAKRFAAKEAAAKALGTGFSEGVTARQIVVVHDRRGCPGLRLAAAADRRRQLLGAGEAYLSISDERDHAIAFVTLLRG